MAIRFWGLEDSFFQFFTLSGGWDLFYKKCKDNIYNKLKKYIAGISNFGIIINELCYKKKLYPIVLFKINKNLKIGFHYTIMFFSLAIR